jgi:hypothetical protein
MTTQDEIMAGIVLAAREPGLLRDRIVMADDFDVWPDDVLDAFENAENLGG